MGREEALAGQRRRDEASAARERAPGPAEIERRAARIVAKKTDADGVLRVGPANDPNAIYRGPQIRVVETPRGE